MNLHPLSVFNAVSFGGFKIYHQEDETSDKSFNNAFIRLMRYQTNQKNTFYYLRGESRKAEHSDVLLAIQNPDLHFPNELLEIFHCICYWNMTGRNNFNKSNNLKESYKAFILRSVAQDCINYIEPYSDSFTVTNDLESVLIWDKITGEKIVKLLF